MTLGKILGGVAATALLAGLMSSSAHAAVFDITFSSSQISLGAEVTATLDSDGTDYDITSIAGVVTSGGHSFAITGLVGTAGTVGNVQSSGPFGFDNVITKVGGVLQFDYNGIAITAGPSNYIYNLFTDSFYGLNNALLTTDPVAGTFGAYEETLGTGTIAAVPEAST